MIHPLIGGTIGHLSELRIALSAELESSNFAHRRARDLEAELAQMGRLHVVSEMAASLAHEMSSPIASISNYVQALESLLLPVYPPLPMVNEILRDIAKEAQRAGKLVRSLHGFIMHRTSSIQPEDLNCVVTEIADLFANEARKRRVTLRLELPVGLPRAAIDRIQIGQVLLNLIKNAAESARDAEPQEVIVEIFAIDNRVVAAVRDSGTGLEAAALAQIFEPFYTTKANGMGMGLPICRSIIAAHGGRIDATSQLGQGSTFTFSVPVASEGGAA